MFTSELHNQTIRHEINHRIAESKDPKYKGVLKPIQRKARDELRRLKRQNRFASLGHGSRATDEDIAAVCNAWDVVK